MKYSLAVMLLVGALTSTEAVHLTQHQAPTALQVAEVKAKEAADKSNASKKKLDDLKSKQALAQTSQQVKLTKVNPDKPAKDTKLQVSSTVKDNSGLMVSIEAVKKPEGANKVQELAAMEEALKKATEEAHKQRLALTGESDTPIGSLVQGTSILENKALQELKSKQEGQQKQLLDQLANEEKQREQELKQNIELEAKISQAEKERQNEEILSKNRAEELKKLQEEEAVQKLEAEKREQEFLAAQAVQETKAAAAKKAAAKANLARMKRKHELQRRKAEAQLQMLKVRQQMEAEQAIELEKTNPTPVPVVEAKKPMMAQQKSQVEIDAEKKQAEAEKKQAEAEKKKAEEEKAKKEKAEAETKAAAEKKAAVEKKKAEQEEAAKAKAEAEKKQKEEAEKKKKDAQHSDKIKKMNKELDQFSVTLNRKHFDAAIQAKEDVHSAGFEEPQMRVNTMNLYKKSFTFPQIANNDYAVEQFETLAVAETNLNNDLSNETTYDNFIAASNTVAHNLIERYKDQWIDPKDDRE